APHLGRDGRGATRGVRAVRGRGPQHGRHRPDPWDSAGDRRVAPAARARGLPGSGRPPGASRAWWRTVAKVGWQGGSTMTDPRRLRVDGPVAGVLLDAARGYSVPTEMRRRVLGSLGLPAAAVPSAVAASAAAGLLSGAFGKTLMTLAALATVGGGIAGYRALRPRAVMAAGQQVAPAPRS